LFTYDNFYRSPNNLTYSLLPVILYVCLCVCLYYRVCLCIQSVIASVPPHWRDGVTEDHGSRWAGQAITVDSVAPAGAPPRVIHGQFVHEKTSPHGGSRGGDEL
jgi:hypothetical protein